MYVDDIILLAASVAALQRLVWLCEENLLSLELVINIKSQSEPELVRVSMRRALTL